MSQAPQQTVTAPPANRRGPMKSASIVDLTMGQIVEMHSLYKRMLPALEHAYLTLTREPGPLAAQEREVLVEQIAGLLRSAERNQ